MIDNEVVKARYNFSIVTPNLNHGKYLAKTIESVLANLQLGDEYYIIDGGSTDESIEIIQSYESRITGWVSEQDRGYADAISKGLNAGSAPFQCWINSGDLMLKGSLNEASRYFSNSSAEFIFGDDFYIDSNDNVVLYSSGYVSSLKKNMLFGGWTPLQDACFWRRTLYDRVGGINSDFKFAADYELFLRFTMAGECMYVPCAFSAFRQHDGQKSISGMLNYKAERIRAQQNVLAMQSTPALVCWLKREYFTWAIRFRSRILCRMWNKPHLVGKSIYGIRSGRY